MFFNVYFHLKRKTIFFYVMLDAVIKNHEDRRFLLFNPTQDIKKRSQNVDFSEMFSTNSHYIFQRKFILISFPRKHTFNFLFIFPKVSRLTLTRTVNYHDPFSSHILGFVGCKYF